MEHTIWKIGDSEIPVRIYREWRDSARISMRRTGIIIRLPSILTKSMEQTQLEKFKGWATKEFTKSTAFQQHFTKREYRDGDTLQVGQRAYFLKIEYTELETHRARRYGREIHLKISNQQESRPKTKAVKMLLSRLVALDFHTEILRRVNELNHLTVQKPIKSIRLKYNRSNWGSCSRQGIINLSTCLLFAPEAAVDYVIIHELAHLAEPNHSDRFWNLVEQFMPDYRQQERWLKENWHFCDF